jgi:predicted esterase
VADLSFIHVYEPAPGADRRTLLLLHGVGGDERDLLALARLLQPTAGVLSPRGQVEDRGMLRFFKRMPQGVYDMEDLPRRAAQLSAFVAAAAAHYRFDAHEVMAVGFAEGANIASTMLLACPETLAGAVLFRGAVPMMPDRMPKLPGTPILVSNGRHDRVTAPEDTSQLAALLRAAGADVTVVLQQAAHQLTHADVEQARAWLTSCGPRRSPARTS